MAEYWQEERMTAWPIEQGLNMEFRGRLALRLIETYGAVAGKSDRVDEAGRAVLDLQTPEELVDRCFQIAELFVARAERAGVIRPAVYTEELANERARRFGELERIKQEVVYPNLSGARK